MTRINNSIPNFVYEPIRKYPINSPLYGKSIQNIEQLWSQLGLKGGSEVEVRFLHQDGSPAYYIGEEKTNFVIARYIKSKYPDALITFEASANMIEFDSGLCHSYKELIVGLEQIQSIKEDTLSKFNLTQGPAYVDKVELEYEFINPVHDNVLLKFKEFENDIYKITEFLYQVEPNQKKHYGLDLHEPEWIKYILTIQSKLPSYIINFTKTTAQQLTLSTNNFSDTLWLDQQLLNYITHYYYEHSQSYAPRTSQRGKQREEVVNYRSEHKIGLKGGYRPIAPGSVYYAYLKRTYFDNKQIDGYSLGHVPSSMSHGPVSLKFSLDGRGELVPRTEFRLQDSTSNTLDAQKSIDTMLMDFVKSAYSQFPKYEYITVNQPSSSEV